MSSGNNCSLRKNTILRESMVRKDLAQVHFALPSIQGYMLVNAVKLDFLIAIQNLNLVQDGRALLSLYPKM